MSAIQLELAKAGLAVVAAAVSLLVASVLGRHLNRRWDEVRRQREADLAALASFYQLYGEFFAIWKEWSIARPRPGQSYIPAGKDSSWSLLQRSCAVEGGFEALLVKVSLERTPADPGLDELARFRQAYQSLREAIRANATLDWRAASGNGDASMKYEAFKRLAANFAHVLADERPRPHPNSGSSGETLIAATDVESRTDWWVQTR